MNEPEPNAGTPEQASSLHEVGLRHDGGGMVVALMEMKRALLMIEHENLIAAREEGMGGWLSDHSEAVRYYNDEYEKAKAGMSQTNTPNNPCKE